MIHRPFHLIRLLLCLGAAALAMGCSKEAGKTRSMERARGFYEAGEYEKAKIEYTSLFKGDRNNGTVVAQLGLIWLQQGSGLQALPYLQRAQELGKLPLEAQMRLAFALRAVGKHAESRVIAEALLKADANNGEALLFLAEMAVAPESRENIRLQLDRFPFKETAFYHLATSELLRYDGQLAEAEAAVERAVEVDPKSSPAHFAAARYKLARRDVEGAKSAIRMGSELAPLRSAERMRYVEFLAQQGQAEEAQSGVAEILKQAPDYLPALVFSAQLAGGKKAYDEGLAILEKVFAMDSTNLGARLLQAELLMAKNEPKQSIDVLQRLDEAYNGLPMIRLKLARAKMESGDLKSASDLVNQVSTSAARQPEGKPKVQLEIEAALLLAEINMRSNNPAAVVPAMQALLEKHPSTEVAAGYLARGLEQQRRFEEASKVVQVMVQQRPDNPAYHFRLAQLYLQTGKIAEARAAYEQVLVLKPEDEEAWTRLVDLDLAEKKSDAALERTRVRRERSPDSATAAFTEGRVRIARQEWDQAEAALLKTLELNPNHPTAHEALGHFYVSQGKLPEAVAKVQQRLAVDAKDVRALRLLGMLQIEQKEYAAAAATYEKLLVALPAPDPFVLNNLATLYADHLDKVDQAYELARQARTLHPSTASAVSPEAKVEAASIADTLGWLLYRRGTFPESYALLREAMEVLSENVEIQAHFGLAAAAMGRTDEAKTALGKAVESQTDFSSKAEARQRLALLTGDTTTPQTSAELAAMVEKTPLDPLLQSRLAEALEKENKFAEAAAAYAAALKLNPELSMAALKLAELYAGPLQDTKKAIGFARTARDLAPNDVTIAGVLGGLAYRSGEYQWSYGLLTEAARGETKQSRVLLDLGKAAYSLGRIEEARTAVQQALQATPEAAAAAEAKEFLDLTAVPAPAETRAQEILSKDERSVPALMIVGEARLKAGDTAAAVAAWQKALGIHPDFAPARKFLAMALVNDPATRTQAYDFALKAREALPDDPDLTETLAILTHHRKDHRYAVDLFVEAARTRPPGAVALYYLGASQLALGETEAGRESLTKAVAAGLAGPEAEAAAKLLQSDQK